MVTGTVYKCPECGGAAIGCVLDEPCQRCQKDGAWIAKFLEEHSDLFESLANDILCPSCKKVVKPPFYNLGQEYHYFEGCKKCWEQTHQQG